MRSSPALDLHFPAAESVSARVIARLDDFAPAAVHELGPDDAPVWRVFFATGPERDEAARAFEAEFSSQGLACRAIDVPDEDWAARSQAGLRAVRVARIVVAPPWDVPAAGSMAPAPSPAAEATSGADLHQGRADIVAIIQPSMGFGTGHHETTRLCLELLQEIELAGREVLDVGTGSGVLAIAAALLGARHVRAVDVDDDALMSARENLALNRDALSAAGCTIDVAAGDVRHGLAPADLVLANLTGGALVSSASALRGAVRESGSLLVSGFQPFEAVAVIEALAPPGARVERRRQGDWEAALIQLSEQA